MLDYVKTLIQCLAQLSAVLVQGSSAPQRNRTTNTTHAQNIYQKEVLSGWRMYTSPRLQDRMMTTCPNGNALDDLTNRVT